MTRIPPKPKKDILLKKQADTSDQIVGPTAPDMPRFTFIKDVSDYVIGTSYAFTINPCDRYQYFEHEERFNMFCKWLLKLMHGVRAHAALDLHTEICQKGRLHAHGTIIFKDVYGFFLKDYRTVSSMCVIDIDIINHKDVWDTYVSKQRDASTYKHYTLDDTSFKICKVDINKFKVTKYIKTQLDDNIQLDEISDNG